MPDNYVLLEKITVGAAGAASVTFTNIPQTGYTDLVVKGSVRTNVSAIWDDVNFVFNSNSSGYTNKFLQGTGAGAGSGNASPASIVATINGNTATAGTYGTFETYIPNYTGSNTKSYSTDSVSETNGTTAYAMIWAQQWANTAPITSITLSVVNGTSFIQNTTFYIYGVAKLNITPTVAPKASGGDIIMTDGTYWYHAFRSSGAFTPATSLYADILVVAGGGSGGGTTCCGVWPGGGGAGGVFYASSQPIATVQTITIGAGGAAPTAGGHPNGNSGSNSVFGSLTAAVGGGYGSGIQQAGGAGGSGGGAGDYTDGQVGGAGTAGQGFAGGNGGGGGGGGAGAAGTAGTRTTNGVAGGIGTNTYSSWLSPTGLGVSGYIAGGGGGSASTGGTAGPGGLGGGGASGTYQNNGIAAIANTGSGGGAGGQSQGPNTIGGAGGSGLVIVRYLVA